MLKLKKLIKEHTWDREFGEPLPTFKGVMKQHQINKLEEGWWDDMSDAAKKAYIKKHGEAPSVAGDDEDDYDMGEVPGSRGTGPWTPEDDPDFEHGPTLTSAPGRVPDEEDEESSGRTGKELDQETLTIDGKQFRRISEGVEKQSKPKYAFSEFYERFKK